ncbi:hypothetical protein Fmac_032998 [Flemingia macrophylla]|uniref:Uncharacterized protein n=1 Tax=Flemingia macrophylla TaxID=520843 RepID=A0ABD1L6I5_9FABA
MLGEFGAKLHRAKFGTWHPATFLAKLAPHGGRRARFGTPGRGFGKVLALKLFFDP